MYTNDRNAYRQYFFTAWQKYQKKLLLEPMEAQLVDIILQHPEYHRFLDNTQQQEFDIAENPFIHMSLHSAIRDQITMRRPAGIDVVYQRLMNTYRDALHVEHLMMEQLVYCLQRGQQTGTMPSESEYLQALQAIK